MQARPAPPKRDGTPAPFTEPRSRPYSGGPVLPNLSSHFAYPCRDAPQILLPIDRIIGSNDSRRSRVTHPAAPAPAGGRNRILTE